MFLLERIEIIALRNLQIQLREDTNKRFVYSIYTIYYINIIPEIRAILLLFLIIFLKFYLTIVEFNYLNIILIVKLVRPNAIVSLRSKYNTKRLISFYFENYINSIFEYNDLRSRKYILYVLRSSKLKLYL